MTTTVTERGAMQLTITIPNDYPQRTRDEQIVVAMKEIDTQMEEYMNKASDTQSDLPFLHSGFWEGDETPTDLSTNTDHYLYDE